MSRNELKVIAIIAMTFDHVALVFIASDSMLYYIMRLVGRLTAPIMAFMLVEGFRHTSNRQKYLYRLSLFALISQPFYFRMIFQRSPNSSLEFFTNWNVMFTLAVTLAALCITESKMQTMPKVISAAVCISLASFADWSYLIPAWAFIFRYLKKDFRKMAACFSATSVVLQTIIFLKAYDSLAHFSFQFGTLFALIPLHFYNESKNELKKKSRNRWSFYIYYPAHMLLLVLIRAST